MKKVVGLIIGVVLFAVFIGGAGFLYNNLAADYDNGQNLVLTKESEESEVIVTESGQALEQEEQTAVKETDSEAASEEAAGNKDTTENSEAAEREKIMAVDFHVEDEEGNSVNLLSFVGKPIVLNFWASWCGPCKNELPDFQAAYEKYEGEIEFVMVNMTDGVRETKEIASSFVTEQGYTLPVYYDTAQEAAYTYGVYSLPTTYFIAEDGEIIAGAQGMIDADTLETGISMIYKAE